MAGKLQFENKKFNRLTVIQKSYTRKGKRYWVCCCDCGKTSTIVGWAIVSGHTKSCGCLGKFSFGEGSFNRLYSNYKNSARKRKINFNLTKEEFKMLTEQNCYYCEEKPTQIFKGHQNNGYYQYNGIDRQNNNEGYNIENCVACCGWCNKMKLEKTHTEFISKIKHLYGLFEQREW